MNFTIDNRVFDFFPGMRLAVAILKGFNNQMDKPEVQTELRESWISAGKAATEYGNPQSHPRIKPWVDHFKELGVSRKQFPSSIEALVRRAGKGGEPISINPLVDFYNSISLKYLVTAGGYDLDQLDHGLELRFSRTGDEFQALDDESIFDVPEGEIILCRRNSYLNKTFSMAPVKSWTNTTRKQKCNPGIRNPRGIRRRIMRRCACCIG